MSKAKKNVSEKSQAQDQANVSKPKVKRSEGREVAGAVPVTSELSSNNANRHTIFGVSTSKFLKWAGAHGWTVKEASGVLTHLGLTVSASTISCQLYSGRALANDRTPTHTGKPAEFDKGQIGELEALREKVRGLMAAKK